MFTRPRVNSALSKFVIAKLSIDSGKFQDDNRRLIRERFRLEPTLPIYLVLKPTGEVVAVQAGMERSEEKFVQFLEKGL
ncbi:MAG: hypothetical protein HYZ53_20415 [Planctomycetes bacterium]|nr:hypothetical protein [Planctomycetota bacterium]